MNTEVFAEWLRRQGHQVLRSESSYWYSAGPRAFQAFPFGSIISPSESELRTLMLKHGILALRFSTPLDSQEGLVSYHVVLHEPYNLEMLNHRARNGIRRGLSACQVERISLKRLAEEGWDLQRNTLERQDRSSSMSQAEWLRICHSAEELPGFEAWGAIVGEELAASILTVRVGDTFYVPYAQCQQKYMAQHVNNALFYEASRGMLSTDGIREIFYSLHSLDAPESVNEFKFRMSFIAKPVRQRVALHPLLAPFVNKTTYSLLLHLLQRYPSSHILPKAEGMLRFYIQGKRELNEQEWPSCLSQIKANSSVQH